MHWPGFLLSARCSGRGLDEDNLVPIPPGLSGRPRNMGVICEPFGFAQDRRNEESAFPGTEKQILRAAQNDAGEADYCPLTSNV